MVRTFNIEYINDINDNEPDIHELLCKAIHESDQASIETLQDLVTDIEEVNDNE